MNTLLLLVHYLVGVLEAGQQCSNICPYYLIIIMKCSELGWLCIPLVVLSYGAWGKEAMESFSSLASRLAITSSRPKSAVLSELYGWLNLNLVRANMRAIMFLPSRLFLKCYLVLVMFSCVLYVR